MRYDAFSLHVDPVITEMTHMQQIPLSQVCSSDESEIKVITAEKNLQRVFSTGESEPERDIVNEIYTDESESEGIQKSINTNELKYEIDKIEDEEPSVTYNTVIN